MQLQVHLGDGVVGENGGVRDITCTIETHVSRAVMDETLPPPMYECMHRSAFIAQLVSIIHHVLPF